MSYFRRGYQWEMVHYLPAPVGGWNPDAPSWELPQNQAPILDNFLIQPGKIVARGGFVQNSYSAYAPVNLCGALLLSPQSAFSLLGRRTASATAVVDPWRAPLVKSNSSQLAAANVSVLQVSGGTVTPATFTLDQVPGFQWINYDGSYYGISYDASTAPTTSHDTNNTYTTKNTNLLIWNGAGTPTVGSGSPRGAVDLKGHVGRLWLLGGVDVPGAATVHNPNVIFFSNPMPSPGGLFAADWQDPASGLTNQIVMDRNNDDPGIALAVTRNVLLVFRANSIWAVLGTTTANFTVRLVSKEAGCLDPRSVIETDRGVYFMSDKGLMLTNGVTVTNVSGTVTRTLQQAIGTFLQFYSSRFAIPYVTCAQTTGGAILVSLGSISTGSPSPAGAVLPLWSGLYDPATNTWSRVTSGLWTNEGSAVNVNPNSYPGLTLSSINSPRVMWAFGDKYYTILEDGTAGNLALSTPRILLASGGRALYDQSFDAATYVPIPLRWQTRIAPIVGATTLARKFGQAKRYFLDYMFAPHNNYQLTAGWSVTPKDVTGTSLGSVMTTQITPLVTGSSINGFRQGTTFISRDNADFANEIDDLSFDVTWTDANRTSGGAPVDAIAELYGVGVEFQPTRDLR